MARTTTGDRPGVVRLRAQDAKPRELRARAVVQAIIAQPLIARPRKTAAVPSAQRVLL